MSSHDDARPGEMTDTQLDQFLAAANRELLGHIETTTDPHGALTAIMTQSTQEAPSPQTASALSVSHDPDRPWAAVIISLRVHTRDLVLDLGRAHDLAAERGRDLHDVPADILFQASGEAAAWTARLLRGRQEIFLPLDDDLALGIDQAFGSARELALDLNLGYTRASGQALGRASDLARELARASGQALGRPSDLARDIVNTSYRFLDRRTIETIEALISELASYSRILDRRTIDALGRASDLARELESDLDAQQVDASGADLSDLEIMHLDVLERIIWTRLTTWPPGIADHVEERSVEIQPGVYQVRFGNTTNRHVLIPV